jgi:hypothetical protein
VGAGEDSVRVGRHEFLWRSLDGPGRPPEARGGREAAGAIGRRLSGGRSYREHPIRCGAFELCRSARCPAAAFPGGECAGTDSVLASVQLCPALQDSGWRVGHPGSGGFSWRPTFRRLRLPPWSSP